MMERRQQLVNSIMAAIFAALMGILSQFSVPIGAVPVTLQTLIASLAGIVLGRKWGTVSVAVWILVGVFGVPVFANARSGPAVLFSPTGGYIIGFLLISWISGTWIRRNRPFWMNYLTSVLSVALCYAFGLTVFVLYFRYGLHKDMTLVQALVLTVLPFFPFDLIKMVISVTLGLKVRQALIMAGFVREER